jgi:hypothetical protein
VHAVTRTFVQLARVRQQMSPTGSILVQTNHLMAERTFSIERMEAPPSRKLYELNNPYQ